MDLYPQLYRKKNKASLVYHGLFDYPLSERELVRWTIGEKVEFGREPEILEVDGYFGLDAGSVVKRKMREAVSREKMKVAKKAARVIGGLPSVKMVAVTGSLAMENASREADIDLMLVTSGGTLWVSRALVYFLLYLGGHSVRRFGVKDERDKLCLNIWMDETSLEWEQKNIFTAHEVLAAKPLVNKDGTYERYIGSNRWALEYWQKGIKRDTRYVKRDTSLTERILSAMLRVLEPVARLVQKRYMRDKVTHEKVGKRRAVFHPNDLSPVIIALLVSRGFVFNE